MNKAALTAILLVTALGLGTAGCGGSDSGGEASDAGNPPPSSPQESSSGSQESASDSQESSSSPQDFAEQADAVCAEGGKQTKAEFAAFSKEHSKASFGEIGSVASKTKALELEAAVAIGVPAFRRQIDELQALEAPSDDAAQVDAYLKALEDELKEVEQAPLLLLNSASKVFAESDKLAQQLGLKDCGGH